MRLRTTRSRLEKKIFARNEHSSFSFFFSRSRRSLNLSNAGSRAKILHFYKRYRSYVRKIVLTICPYEVWISVQKNHAAFLWFQTTDESTSRAISPVRDHRSGDVAHARAPHLCRHFDRRERQSFVDVTCASFTRAKASNTAACLDSPLPSFEGSAARRRTRVSPSRPTAARCPPTRISRCASARTTPTP